VTRPRWSVALGLVLGLATGGCTVNPPPVVVTTPKYPDFPALVVPASLKPSTDTTTRLDVAWRRLQSGDLTGARRDYAALVQQVPTLYPAEAGLGYVALAGRDYKEAAADFGLVLEANARYRPALDGRAEAALGAGDDAMAIQALQAILKVDPTNDSAKTRLDVVRFRQIQREIDGARRAREAGRLDEAQALLERALVEAPPGAVIFRELALVDLAKGQTSAAEGHAHKAVDADPSDAESWAALGAILDKAGRSAEASDDYGKAYGLDPRPAWRDRREALRLRAVDEAEPKEFRDIATAPTVNRADVAAMIGLRLGALLAASPRHVTVVATDAPRSWAATWILPVTQAGVMDVYANHTFQPEAVVRRTTLAEVVSRLLGLLSAEQGTDLSRWKAATPALSDLPTGSPSYGPAALAIAAGAMMAPGNRFNGSQPASGAELVTAISRLQQLLR
jgi:Tfp pilus assembly protein PilF